MKESMIVNPIKESEKRSENESPRWELCNELIEEIEPFPNSLLKIRDRIEKKIVSFLPFKNQPIRTSLFFQIFVG